MIVATVGMYLLSGMSEDTSVSLLITYMVIAGAGMGITVSLFNTVIQNAVDHSQIGVVTASAQLFRNIGGTAGTALFGSMMNAELSSGIAVVGHSTFWQTLTGADTGHVLVPLTADNLGSFLSVESYSAINQVISSLPDHLRFTVLPLSDGFFHAVRAALGGAIASGFTIGAGLFFLGAICTVFLPYVPLRRSHAPVLEQV